VLTGFEAELIVDFTANGTEMQGFLTRVRTNVIVTGLHDRHQDNEAQLEAIRMALGDAPISAFKAPWASQRPHTPPTDGLLRFRPAAKRLFIMCTDEDSDRPWLPANWVNEFRGMNLSAAGGCPQCGNAPGAAAFRYTKTAPMTVLADAYGAELDAVARAAIATHTHVFSFVNPAQASSKPQYGDPACDRADSFDGWSLFNLSATLACLTASSSSPGQTYNNSLQGRLLTAGIISRVFNIAELEKPTADTFLERFFEEAAATIADCTARKRQSRASGDDGDDGDDGDELGYGGAAWKRQAPVPCYASAVCDEVRGCYNRPQCPPGALETCQQCLIDDRSRNGTLDCHNTYTVRWPAVARTRLPLIGSLLPSAG